MWPGWCHSSFETQASPAPQDEGALPDGQITSDYQKLRQAGNW
jgi:hypothetical protein